MGGLTSASSVAEGSTASEDVATASSVVASPLVTGAVDLSLASFLGNRLAKILPRLFFSLVSVGGASSVVSSVVSAGTGADASTVGASSAASLAAVGSGEGSLEAALAFHKPEANPVKDLRFSFFAASKN